MNFLNDLLDNNSSCKRDYILIKLDTKLASLLRKTVNDHSYYFQKYTKELLSSKYTTESAWKITCAIMDRIDDVVCYLNHLKLLHNPNSIEIFDYYNFLNHSSVLINCIDSLAKLFLFDLKDFDSDNTKLKYIIRESLNNVQKPKSSDKKFFEYLRSLCSVHPIETSRHSEFQDKNTKTEYSPFMTYSGYESYKTELIVYLDKTSSKWIIIDWNEIFDFVRYRYGILNEIIPAINKYFNQIEDEFKTLPLRDISSFNNNYSEFINYLNKETSKRITNDWHDVFDFYNHLITFCFTNIEMNMKAIKRYLDGLKASFIELYDYLQKMPGTAICELWFIKYFLCPNFPDKNEDGIDYNYAFEKLSGLWIPKPRNHFDRSFVKQYERIYSSYVMVTDVMSDTEVCYLIYAATYCWGIDNNRYN